MSIVKVDGANPANFKPKEFKVIPKGKYLFEVTNDLVVTPAKTSGNMIVKVEMKCIDDVDDGKYRGTTVFDNIVLTAKAEWKLVSLALACDSQKEADIKENGVDLALIKGRAFEAEIDVQPPSTGPDGTKYREKNGIVRYLFEPEKVPA